MSVSHHLDLEGESPLLAQARDRWDAWTEQEPRLAVVTFDQLRTWLPRATAPEADDVLHALATLAATDGGNDDAAAATLAWTLLPGACTLAHRLETLDERIDELVATQLWIEIRCFPWQRLRKVAANILMNTRAGVLHDAGDPKHLERTDRTWSRSISVSPAAKQFWGYLAAGFRPPVDIRREKTEEHAEGDVRLRRTRCAQTQAEPDPAAEVAAVLDWACENEVISPRDRHLLLCLVEEAAEVTISRTGRSNLGLTAPEVSVRVAPRCGVSEATVRRRAARSLRALAAASDRFVA